MAALYAQMQANAMRQRLIMIEAQALVGSKKEFSSSETGFPVKAEFATL